MVGKIANYRVLRKTDIGYILERENNEYFLHFNDSNFVELKKNDYVDAFLYLDKEKRKALSLYKPSMTVDDFGFATITDDHKNHAFINIGISKDIFLSKDKIFKNQKLLVGGKIFGKLIFKDNDLFISVASKRELESFNKGKTSFDYGYIYRIVEAGINLITPDIQVIFIPKKFLKKVHYLIGERINFVNLKLIEKDLIASEQKINALSDEEVVLAKLKQNHGVLFLTDHSDKLDIEKILNISKRRFKIAIGKLYKQKKIDLKTNKIIIKDEYKK